MAVLDSITSSTKKLKEMLLGREHTPEFIARGAGFGLFVGFTPTTGLQIPILLALRGVLGRRLGFHLPLSILCTLPTNALTLPFIYYWYVVTGRIILGRFDNLRGFEVFSQRMDNTVVVEEVAWYESAWSTLTGLLTEFGLPLAIGSLPWALLAGLVGYALTLRYVRRSRSAHKHQL